MQGKKWCGGKRITVLSIQWKRTEKGDKQKTISMTGENRHAGGPCSTENDRNSSIERKTKRGGEKGFIGKIRAINWE